MYQVLEVRPWDDLPGEFEIRVADQAPLHFIRNQVAVIVEQDLGAGFRPRTYAGWFVAHRSLIDDLDQEMLVKLAAGHLHRAFHPWLHADRPVIRPFDLFPRTAGLWRRFRAILRPVREMPPT